MSIARLLTGDTVTVTPLAGDGAYGPVYGDPVDVDCRVEYERKLVRDSGGAEVVAESTIYALPEAGGQVTVDLFQPGSLATVAGRESQVIGVSPHRGMGDVLYVEITTT